MCGRGGVGREEEQKGGDAGLTAGKEDAFAPEPKEHFLLTVSRLVPTNVKIFPLRLKQIEFFTYTREAS